VQDGVQDGVQDTVQVDQVILRYCMRPKKRREIMSTIGVYNNYDNYVKYVKGLIDQGFISLTIPDKPNSGNQQYKTTAAGEKYLEERQSS